MNEFSAFYGIGNFIVVFISSLHYTFPELDESSEHPRTLLKITLH
jgi:hypothetical protein